MTVEIEKLKADFEIKVGRKKLPLVLARLAKEVVIEDPTYVIPAGVVGCVWNEFGNIYFVIDGKVDGIDEGMHIPVNPDEIELL